ncbi:hypothetical protein CXB26_06380 [Klebsiella pneumoniae]|nr:hypothetical protein CXB26_06380 [Klebsiella pneumoniae]AUD27454.1 hypothetical protein CXB24_06380 [Klebsiella pneumoniae]AUD33005.1 hypothetical protein CXB25_06375 [Klebsiella pneumoniae]HBY1171830.1 hypothetical protein [Klebsiella pneumoniae]
MMSLWDALRMNMMISYQELVRTFPSSSPRGTCLRVCVNEPNEEPAPNRSIILPSDKACLISLFIYIPWEIIIQLLMCLYKTTPPIHKFYTLFQVG